MATRNFRGANRFRGFSSTNRLTGFNRSRGNSHTQSSRNITDARQILQNRSSGRPFGNRITDLSQKLSRPWNGGRLNVSGGRIGKPLYTGQFRKNFAINQNPRNRFQNRRTIQNALGVGARRNFLNNQWAGSLPRSKFIKVHRGGITVTARQQNSQRRQRNQPEDELENMTLADLPELESVSAPRAFSHSDNSPTFVNTQRESENTSTAVLISNLKHTVTEEDIHELFGVVGEMTSARLLHPGTAQVNYARKEDAITALEYYNNVTLDGMAMRCTILLMDKQKRPSISSRLGDRASMPLSASFLSPALPHRSSYLPATGGLRSAGRQVQTHYPSRTQFARLPTDTKFTVCLN